MDEADNRRVTRALAAVIAERRRAAGFTQVRFAEMLGGRTSRNYRKIESGEIRCPPDLLAQIGELLGTRGWQLFKEAEDRFDSTTA